jgi:hypothetical protein
MYLELVYRPERDVELSRCVLDCFRLARLVFSIPRDPLSKLRLDVGDTAGTKLNPFSANNLSSAKFCKGKSFQH